MTTILPPPVVAPSAEILVSVIVVMPASQLPLVAVAGMAGGMVVRSRPAPRCRTVRGHVYRGCSLGRF